MEERNRLLTEIFLSKELAVCLAKIEPESIRDDLKQHVFLLLLEKPKEFITELNKTGKLKNYVVKVIFQLVRFKEDKFHRVQRKQTELPTDFTDFCIDSKLINDDDNRVVEMERHCEVGLAVILNTPSPSQGGSDNVNWYHGRLLQLYVQLGNYRAVSKETGIPIKSVFNAVKQAREEIKRKVECQL